jgi:hypothetical protein
MVDKKLTNSELIRLRRNTALRELALATFRSRPPPTSTPAHRERTESESPVTPLITWPAPSIPPDGVEMRDFVTRKLAEPFKPPAQPVAPTAATLPVESPGRRFRDNPDSQSVAKPWKKPWDI